ncbi:DMT family transporter [Bacillus songklensis]|uniref:DMT family transporter n=1 Tax=Bacillus songklensis TaxID=1069116 RepID=A0ABV8B2G8_9BACI
MKKVWLAEGALLCVAFIWGATFVIVQQAIQYLPPISFNGIRFLIATLFLFSWLLLFQRQQLKQLTKKTWLHGAVMGTCLFAGYAFQTVGLMYTTSSKAGFITGLSVVLVPLFAFLLLKQKLKANGIAGVVIATVGLYFLTLGDKWSIDKGDFLVFLCAISFALHILVTGLFSQRHPTLLLTIIQLGTVTILCVMFAFFMEDWQTVLQTSLLLKQEVTVALVITSLLATALAFLLQTSVQQYTTAARVALIFAMEPVFAAIAAFFWAGERLTGLAVTGCLCIFIGMIIAELPSLKKKTAIEKGAGLS